MTADISISSCIFTNLVLFWNLDVREAETPYLREPGTAVLVSSLVTASDSASKYPVINYLSLVSTGQLLGLRKDPYINHSNMVRSKRGHSKSHIRRSDGHLGCVLRLGMCFESVNVFGQGTTYLCPCHRSHRPSYDVLLVQLHARSSFESVAGGIGGVTFEDTGPSFS